MIRDGVNLKWGCAVLLFAIALPTVTIALIVYLSWS